MFGQRVSLRSSDYFTEVYIKIYKLAFVDDDEETGSTPSVFALAVVVPLKLMDRIIATLVSTLAKIALVL